MARQRLQMESLEERTTPSTFIVSTAADTGTGSLRQAILDSNAAGGMNTLSFVSSLAGQTIPVTGAALPTITDNLTIPGLGQNSLTISGNNTYQVFDVGIGAAATITDLTITKGSSATDGGGVQSDGSLTLTRDTITGNSAAFNGGGVVAETASTLLTISDCLISSNTAAMHGGGVYLSGAAGSSATISNSTISGNADTVSGSGIFVNNSVSTTTTIEESTLTDGTDSAIYVQGSGGGTVNILQDTIAGNSSSLFAGGLEEGGTTNVNVTDTTIAGNTGGGIEQTGTGLLSVLDSTITGNSSTAAGAGIEIGGGENFAMANSIVASNTAPVSNVDVSGTVTGVMSSGNNFIGNTTGFISGGSSVVGTGNPMLGALQNNGGPTETDLPLAGSPVIDAGSNALVPTSVTTDQRGIGRFIGSAVDLGAVEFQPQLMVVSGQTNGSAQTYTFDAAGTPHTVGAAFTPFPGFSGPVRSVTADVNGDGTLDTVYITGPGTSVLVTVINGKDGSVLVPPYNPFGDPGFTGGGFLAAGDFQGNGKDDWVVSPDQGGGPHVVIFSLSGTTPTVLASFFGINDPSFRGGARVAVGDFNGDGTPDLAVAAGFLGGPRVSIYNGLSLFGTPTNLVPDFFAFGGTDATTLRNGVYLTAGDFNGDGFADLAFGGGPGGGPRALVISGELLTGSGGSAAAEATPIANFFAFPSSQRGGVWLASKFTTGSNQPTLVAASGVGQGPIINAYLGATLTGGNPPSTTFPSFTDPTETFGVFVG